MGQGSQKHGQKGRESDLLVSISFLGAQSNSTKRPSHFLPLKIFRSVTLPLEIPDKAKLHPASHSFTLEIPRPKTKTHGNST